MEVPVCDAILVTAPAVRPPLVEHLADGGRLVIPFGSADHYELSRLVRRGGST